MSDLEKFLQQAAQRMKERQQAGGSPPPQQQPRQQPVQQQRPPQQRPPQQRQSQQRPPVRPQPAQVFDAEIVEAEVVDQPRELGPDRLSSIDTRPKPGTANVNMADERMASHVQQVFEHGVGQLSQKPVIQVNEPSAAPSDDQTRRKTEVHSQKQNVHWMTEMLRQPETVRALFIASEVFKRKF